VRYLERRAKVQVALPVVSPNINSCFQPFFADSKMNFIFMAYSALTHNPYVSELAER
jgi:hypothetical protein